MSLLAADPKLLAVWSFIAFLSGHIEEIQPNLVLFLFDTYDSYYANVVAVALRGRQMLMLQTEKFSKRHWTIKEDTLLLMFGDSSLDNTWILFTSVRVIVLDLEPLPTSLRNNSTATTLRPVFALINHERLQPNMVWSMQQNLKGGMLEENWLRSFQWSVFVNRVHKLPANHLLGCYDNALTDRSSGMILRNDLGFGIAIGMRIGFYKIFMELMGTKGLRYFYTHQYIDHRNRPILTSFRDRRLIVQYPLNGSFSHAISLSPNGQTFPNMFLESSIPPMRYMVVVPRIVINSTSNQLKEFTFKCQVIGGLFLTTCIFVSIRFGSHQFSSREPEVETPTFMLSFFDTFARMLGVGAGAWQCRSTAERLLLSVIAVIAFFWGSFLSGVLYEQMFIREDLKFCFNNLDDLCLAGKELHIPIELILKLPGLNIEKKKCPMFLSRSNCTLILRPYSRVQNVNETTTALVCPEDALPVLGYSKTNTMVLKDPYLTVAARIGATKYYMKTAVHKWITRFDEHGIMAALRSVAEHWEAINDMKLKRKMITTIDESVEDPSLLVVTTMFEYWMLISGLVAASLIFIIEIVLKSD